MIRDLGLKDPYVGQTELTTGEIADDLTYYFAKSEQIPSVTGLGVLMAGNNTVKQAGGFLIQLMPDASEETLAKLEKTAEELHSVTDLLEKGMESHKIMDRLICGDVGYGKTEIAIRAAFKAVQESRQVALLVPTTILAQQHYNTFVQRMKDFPVRIDLLCRFRTPAQQAKTIRDLKNGQVDIVIGTHRLISKDVKFKDLGLLVIDEEQRFGVAHKEKIKQLRKNVDVLTLTATPIPRTLHMSLIGIRDMIRS